MKQTFHLLLLTALVTACVPKNQYDAIVAERDYYRNEITEADSLADLASVNTYDNNDLAANDLSTRIQQVERLTATNRALNESYQQLLDRYNELLGQNQSLLTTSGDQVSGLQQSLAERTAEISRREAELRQLELDIQAREANVAGLESSFAPAGGGEPASYGGTLSATTPLNAYQNVSLDLNTMQNEIGQVLGRLPRNMYVIAPAGQNRLQVTLNEPAVFRDGFSVSAQGQALLRDVAATLRSFPQAEVTVVGHADGLSANGLRAYEDSTDKAINIATQLVNYGVNPAKITAGGRGFHDPITTNDDPAGQLANRRTDLLITLPQ